MAENVLIFDTSLRDGEQSPGVALTTGDKVEIAQQLERLGVDIIEAGFPRTSPGDLEAVATVARIVRKPVIAALAHAHPEAVDDARDSLKEAARPRIHVFLSSSDIHMMHQLRKDRDEVLDMARTMVARAKRYVEDVEFSPMDATRSEREYVYRMLQQCIDAGATTVNIPDTVGYTVPEEFEEFIKAVFQNVPNIHKTVVSVHCHNDLGLA
ncbi:MAG: 2-isopropylmalate synthase, partial [Dehalococcoidia bacterium]|nr:2-isopropylmalate synthase [Dehalococcoidia bacterium]